MDLATRPMSQVYLGLTLNAIRKATKELRWTEDPVRRENLIRYINECKEFIKVNNLTEGNKNER